MPRKRQSPDDLVMVRSFGATMQGGSYRLPQSPAWGQLIYATRGALTVALDAGLWYVPGRRALWVPPGEPYRLEMGSRVQLRSLYVARDRCGELPAACRALAVSPLLHELVLHVAHLNTLQRGNAVHAHLLAVLLDQLQSAPAASLRLPLPQDGRGARAADLMMRSPGTRLSLSGIARQAGASLRTLERTFERETGLKLTAWRQRLRALQALRLLAEGGSVGDAALAAGYQSASAFIAMFKREMGFTPKQAGSNWEP